MSIVFNELLISLKICKSKHAYFVMSLGANVKKCICKQTFYGVQYLYLTYKNRHSYTRMFIIHLNVPAFFTLSGLAASLESQFSAVGPLTSTSFSFSNLIIMLLKPTKKDRSSAFKK